MLEEAGIREARNFLHKEKERVSLNENTVRLLNPENVLKRGYTLTLKNGKIVKSVHDVQVDETIETRFTDGKTESKIIKRTENDSKKNKLQ
jgi:exodeoxyribonuclease VII large subunit